MKCKGKGRGAMVGEGRDNGVKGGEGDVVGKEGIDEMQREGRENG